LWVTFIIVSRHAAAALISLLQVYDEWMRFAGTFGDVSVVPTKHFCTPLKIGEEVSFEIEQGKTLYIRLKAIGAVSVRCERRCRRKR